VIRGGRCLAVRQVVARRTFDSFYWSRPHMSRYASVTTDVGSRPAVERLPFEPDLAGFEPWPRFVETFDIAFARQHRLMGLQRDDRPVVAVCDRTGWLRVDLVRRLLALQVAVVATTGEQIQQMINRAYEAQTGQTQELIDSLDRETVLSELDALGRHEDLLDTAGRAPVIRLVNLILFEAVKNGASDIHIQPYENRVVVRQRIDGVLFDTFEIPKDLHGEVATRIKVLGRMDIAEKRLPQDGRATVQVGERLIDLRIASLPTSHMERLVIRLLDKSARLHTLGEIGMDDRTLSRFRRLIQLDHGLLLVTGPTGSGKSTTLYAALQEINTTTQNVLTLEDPIEYQLEGVSQTQINEKKGMTFARGLRNVLRQDPDIIMVGEIRDRETAVMAIQASLTGHLVFSTLHTNDAASAVTRLLDLGIEPYLVTSSLVAALAQRLVRCICRECKTPVAPAEARKQLAQLGVAAPCGPIYRGRGCPACRDTGYRGRVGLFELLVLDESARELVQRRGSAAELRESARRAGMAFLQQDGLSKVLDGTTTVEEVLRVTRAVQDRHDSEGVWEGP